MTRALGEMVIGAAGDQRATVGGGQADRAAAAALPGPRGEVANAVAPAPEDGAAWEVEVTPAGGPTIDVRLDDRYGFVAFEPEGDATGEDAAP